MFCYSLKDLFSIIFQPALFIDIPRLLDFPLLHRFLHFLILPTHHDPITTATFYLVSESCSYRKLLGLVWHRAINVSSIFKLAS